MYQPASPKPFSSPAGEAAVGMGAAMDAISTRAGNQRRPTVSARAAPSELVPPGTIALSRTKNPTRRSAGEQPPPLSTSHVETLGCLDGAAVGKASHARVHADYERAAALEITNGAKPLYSG